MARILQVTRNAWKRSTIMLECHPLVLSLDLKFKLEFFPYVNFNDLSFLQIKTGANCHDNLFIIYPYIFWKIQKFLANSFNWRNGKVPHKTSSVEAWVVIYLQILLTSFEHLGANLFKGFFFWKKLTISLKQFQSRNSLIELHKRFKTLKLTLHRNLPKSRKNEFDCIKWRTSSFKITKRFFHSLQSKLVCHSLIYKWANHIIQLITHYKIGILPILEFNFLFSLWVLLIDSQLSNFLPIQTS